MQGVNSTQLLTNMVPVSAVIVLILVPLLDRTGLFFAQENSLVNYEFTPAAMYAVAGSAVLAVFVNRECLCVFVCVCIVSVSVHVCVSSCGGF